MTKKLESIGILSIVIHAMIGIELMTIPINAVKYAKNDAWLSPFFVGAIILFNAQLGFFICKKHPGLNFAQINEKLYGKVFGKILISVSIVYNIYINGVSLRLFSESLNLFLLERTPVIITMVISLLIVFYCTMMDFETINAVFDILLPVVLFSIGLLIIISLTAITPYNLYPPLYRGFVPIMKGALSTLNPAAASFVFAFILPMYAQPQATKKYVNLGIIIATFIYSIIIILCIMVFGATETNHLVFPTLTLSKAIQFENQVFERTETLFMTAWIPNALTTFIAYFTISTISTKALFNTKKDTLIKASQLPIILIIALLPKNKVELFKMLDYANLGVIFLSLIYVPIVFLTTLIKEGGNKNKAQNFP